MTNRPTIPDRRTAQLGGVLLVCLGSWMLYDAYEGRGRSRPFMLRLLPS